MSVVSGAAAGRWAIAAVVTVVVASAPAAYARLPTAESSLRPGAAARAGPALHPGRALRPGRVARQPRAARPAPARGGRRPARRHHPHPGLVALAAALAGRPDHGHRGVRHLRDRGRRADVGLRVRLDRAGCRSSPGSAPPGRRPAAAAGGPTGSWRASRPGPAAALPAHRVAGRSADGIRVLPGRPASTVGRSTSTSTAHRSAAVAGRRPARKRVPALRTAFVDVLRQAAGRRPRPRRRRRSAGSAPPAPPTWQRRSTGSRRSRCRALRWGCPGRPDLVGSASVAPRRTARASLGSSCCRCLPARPVRRWTRPPRWRARRPWGSAPAPRPARRRHRCSTPWCPTSPSAGATAAGGDRWYLVAGTGRRAADAPGRARP